MTRAPATGPDAIAALQAELDRLSDELQETNRGVVALYAELDEKGARLREASDAKTRFLANVSHELRSPLNSVLALAGLLREPDSEPLTTDQDNQIRLIQSAANQLLTLVNDLLDLAKAEAGALQPQLSDVDLDALMHELQATLRPMTPHGVELIVATNPVPIIRTDPMLLGQVLRNLMTNALKYTERGTVTVAAHARPGAVTIAVADTGIGIAAEHQDLVFEQFFQVPHPLQTRAKGTGLGLPYAHRVVAALGGTLSVVSAPGTGTTFTVTLPAPAEGAPGDREGGEVGTALVVDDDEAFRLVLRRLLDGVADRIVEAGDAPTAAEVMRTLRPDVVLLDLHMPGGGGADVLRQLSGPGPLPQARVVVITSAAAEVSGPIARGRPVVDKSTLTRSVLLDAIAASGQDVGP